jgi:hypothetical protein
LGHGFDATPVPDRTRFSKEMLRMPDLVAWWMRGLRALARWATASVSVGIVLVPLVAASFCGCGEQKAVIPSGELTEEQKQAIKAEDAKVAEEEGHKRAK